MRSATLKSFALVGLVAFSFFLYWGCRNSAFIWDDRFLVAANPLIRSPRLFFEAFRHFLGEEPATNFYRPVQTVSYLLDYWRGGLVPSAYHDGNMLLHGLNGALLFLFIQGLLRRETQVSEYAASLCGLLGALLWISHPIYSATVAYIAGRADSLALAFLLTGWCLWDAFLRKRQRVFAVLIFLAGLLAVCSKEAALTGVGLFVVVAVFSKSGLRRNEKIAVLSAGLGLFAIYLVLRLSIAPGEASSPMQSQGNRFVLMLRALGDYGRLLFFPGNLRMERQVAPVPNLFIDPATFDPLYPYLAWLGLLLVAFLAFSAFRKGASLRVRRFGALWFVAFFLPISNLLTLNATVAEHWLYIPSIGFFLVLIGWTLETGRKTQRVFIGVACLAIAGFTFRTKLRVQDWKSPIVFFESTIRDGGDTARMRVSLAYEYQQRGEMVKAEKMLRSVLAQSPTYPQARHALMMNLRLQGRSGEADQLFSDEAYPFGKSFRGRLYRAQKLIVDNQIPEAATALRELREEFPDSWLVTKEIGGLTQKMGNQKQAIVIFEAYAATHWWHAESQLQLAKFYEAEKRPKEAAAAYLRAAQLDIRDTAIRKKAHKMADLSS